MVFGDFQEITEFTRQLYTEIEKNKHTIEFSHLAKKKPIDLLRIYGRINICRIDSVLNKKIVKDEYKKVEDKFKKTYAETFDPLAKGKEPNRSRMPFFSNRSVYNPERILSIHIQICREISRYLSYQPFPVEQAKCLKLYKIKKMRENEVTPYEYAKKLRNIYFERIDWIYKSFGGAQHIIWIRRQEALQGELEEIKCQPFPLQEASWKDTLIAWSKDPEWGGRLPQIGEAVLSFSKSYYFSPFLDLNERARSEKMAFHVATPADFSATIGQFENDPFFKMKNFSFKAYVVEKTIQEFFKHLFATPNLSDFKEIKQAFSNEMQNEKRRSTFVYFFMETIRSYENVAKFDYPRYQETLESRFKDLKHLTHAYKGSEKKEEGYQLSGRKSDFFNLLLSCLMAIHVFKICQEFSLDHRREIFKGICQMEPFQMKLSEKSAFYDFLRWQAKKAITERRQSMYEIIARNLFSALSPLRSSSAPTAPSSHIKEANEFLKKYSFSETDKTRIMIQLVFFHKGLTKNAKAEAEGLQPIDFDFCVKLILGIQEIGGFQLPANVVAYILTWNYLSKEEFEELQQFKDRLADAKRKAQEFILKDKGLFFISSQSRQYIHEVVSSLIPKSTFVPKNKAKEQALSNCLQYIIYPHIASSYFYPFIFLAFEPREVNSRFGQIQTWGKDHCGVFRKLESSQSALRVDTCWKKNGNDEYFQLHLTYFPSSHEARSFHIEETLKIPKARLMTDSLLCQILRVFSIFLADEFEPIKPCYLKSVEQRKHAHKGIEKKKAESIKTGGVKSDEQRKREDKGKGKKKLDEPETPPESPEPPGYNERLKGEIHSIEDLLVFFDNPLFFHLWEIYPEESDKKELGNQIYEFFFKIKRNIRKKMANIYFPDQFPTPQITNILERTTYSDERSVSLVPLDECDIYPAYRVVKEEYREQMSAVLEKVKSNSSYAWKDLFTIDVGGETLNIGANYRFSEGLHSDYHQLLELELEAISDERTYFEEDPRNIRRFFFRFDVDTAKSSENLIEAKHEIIFFCVEKEISFSMTYQEVPSLNNLYWQIVMLKWEYFKDFELSVDENFI